METVFRDKPASMCCRQFSCCRQFLPRVRCLARYLEFATGNGPRPCRVPEHKNLPPVCNLFRHRSFLPHQRSKPSVPSPHRRCPLHPPGLPGRGVIFWAAPIVIRVQLTNRTPVGTVPGIRMPRCGRDQASRLAPKEQPPRKLSGKRTASWSISGEQRRQCRSPKGVSRPSTKAGEISQVVDRGGKCGRFTAGCAATF